MALEHLPAETSDDPFDRQKRIDWWRQDVIENARALVIGAGAIGNEVIKNLVLLGWRKLSIWDFDQIEASNLSRTVLFRREDVGRGKAEVAAERARDMALHPHVEIDWRGGDVVWDLGLGLVRSADIVFGCLDNVEARLAINRACHIAGVPWVDAGTGELNCHVSVYLPGERGCYECGVSERDFYEARRRYSCDNVRRAMVQSGRVPTVQVASALCAALQVEEAIKVLHGDTSMDGRSTVHVGGSGSFNTYGQPRRAGCMAHVAYPQAQMLPLSRRATLRRLLEGVGAAEKSGQGARLDLTGDREFVVAAACRRCLRPRSIMKPQFQLFETDLACAGAVCDFYGDMPDSAGVVAGVPTEKDGRAVFSLTMEPEALLDLTLAELGVPDRHILAVESADGAYAYYELLAENAPAAEDDNGAPERRPARQSAQTRYVAWDKDDGGVLSNIPIG